MGRTLRTTNDLIRKEIGNFKNFRRALWTADQKALDTLFVAAQKRAAAISLIDHALPFESMLVAMLLEQQREIDNLGERVKHLEREIKKLRYQTGDGG